MAVLNYKTNHRPTESVVIKIIWVHYKIEDRDIIDEAYSHIE